MTFDSWTERIDYLLMQKIGLYSSDLPDQEYMDMYEDGLTPVQAVNEILENVSDTYASGYTQEFDDFSDADPGL
jgi:hypothetical protein